MTAEIGILNKSAVVIAADSAVTIGNGRKVFNTANKIFQLSYNDAVGIMIYNNANWMGIPLELIIKIYRDKITKKFSELEDCADDFMLFLDTEFKKHIEEDIKSEVIEYKLYESLDIITDSVTEIIDENIRQKIITRPKTEDEERTYFEQTLLEYLDVLTSKKDFPKSANLKAYSITKFSKTYNTVFEKVISGFLSIQKISEKNHLQTKKLIVLRLYQEIVSEINDDDDFTGIVIAGYGLDEIYPSIIDIRLSFLIDNIIKVEKVKNLKITSNRTAIVKPFAQREMVDTFFQGIDPQLDEKTNELLIDLLDAFKNDLIEKYKTKISKNFLEKKLSNLLKTFYEKTDEIRKEIHIDPIITTIEVLRKEDLIEIAESLVGITTLKRKATLDIETVGGPVDIAVITKGEGFVWIKRKENINKELNHIFFEREMKKINNL
ncbi:MULTISPECIES: hypothetical protein [unclassified Pedobacter]|uniref:hypothetical protein n=1 Tax=unclassified Pedobacter TaxID=2628915 RepID=UPI001DFAD321|nr:MULTISPECIES: hypothetical protein [unclassified Pedobacter]CAH0154446.1 hypothetical protein SRABI126_00617 [Pedobacter sp. Bi126]CAH0203872.1 hypothetical protein SRABI36_02063 [Pedobacter sp. Bi36]